MAIYKALHKSIMLVSLYICVSTSNYLLKQFFNGDMFFIGRFFKSLGNVTTDFMVSRTLRLKFHESLSTLTWKFSWCPKDKCRLKKLRLKIKSLRTCCRCCHDHLTWMLFKICRRKFHYFSLSFQMELLKTLYQLWHSNWCLRQLVHLNTQGLPLISKLHAGNSAPFWKSIVLKLPWGADILPGKMTRWVI